MGWADGVTFGGSGLDRAAELRGDAAGLAALCADPASRAIVLWRGKPLVRHGAGGTELVRLATDHPVLASAAPSPIFLGREDGGVVMAHDLSDWVPDGVDPAALAGFSDRSEQQHPGLPAGDVFAELRAVMTRLTPRDAELAATARAVQGWHDGHGFCARCGVASVITQAGWQRDCPACGAHHFPRTDPVVIMAVMHGNRMLMGRSPGWPDRMYSLLAGFIEPGETIEAAVRRETFEEAGIRVGAVRYVASQPWPFPASLMLACAADAETETITVDPHELEDALWISREDMAQVFAGTHPQIGPARKGAIAHHVLSLWLADKLV